MKTIYPGDIFKFVTKKGIAYVQCVKMAENSNEVEMVRVFYKLWDNGTEDLDKMIGGEYFFVRMPLKAAVRKNIFTRIGTFPLPTNLIIPNNFRIEHPLLKGWHIVNAETLQRTTATQLTNEQKLLSPWGVWNDTLLQERLENGWRLGNWI